MSTEILEQNVRDLEEQAATLRVRVACLTADLHDARERNVEVSTQAARMQKALVEYAIRELCK